MSEDQLLLMRKLVEEVMYSTLLGKSALWLFGNIVLGIFLIVVICLLVSLNMRSRQNAGIPEKHVFKWMSIGFVFLQQKIATYRFYLEVALCTICFAFLTHLSLVVAFVVLGLYLVVKFVLVKPLRKLFVLNPGAVVSKGVYICVFLCYLVLGVMFNFMPAFVEVIAQQTIQNNLLEE